MRKGHSIGGAIGAREVWVQCVECRLMFRAELANRERAVRQLSMRLCAMHESLEYLGRIAAMTMCAGAAAPESEKRTRWA